MHTKIDDRDRNTTRAGGRVPAPLHPECAIRRVGLRTGAADTQLIQGAPSGCIRCALKAAQHAACTRTGMHVRRCELEWLLIRNDDWLLICSVTSQMPFNAIGRGWSLRGCWARVANPVRAFDAPAVEDAFVAYAHRNPWLRVGTLVTMWSGLIAMYTSRRARVRPRRAEAHRNTGIFDQHWNSSAS